MRPIWYREAPQTRLLPIPLEESQLLTVPSTWAGPDSLSLHGLEIIGRASHVFQVGQGLQGIHDFTHQGSGFGVPAKAPSSQLDGLLGALYGEVPFKPRIYQTVESSPVPKMWPGPLHQVMLPIMPGFVHGSSTSYHFK